MIDIDALPATLKFYNAFDDIAVTLEDEETPEGKFIVCMVHGDESMPVTGKTPAEGDTREVFTEFAAARARFLELVNSEIDAVMSQY